VFFNACLQERLSVSGLPSLLKTIAFTRPGHRFVLLKKFANWKDTVGTMVCDLSLVPDHHFMKNILLCQFDI